MTASTPTSPTAPQQRVPHAHKRSSGVEEDHTSGGARQDDDHHPSTSTHTPITTPLLTRIPSVPTGVIEYLTSNSATPLSSSSSMGMNDSILMLQGSPSTAPTSSSSPSRNSSSYFSSPPTSMTASMTPIIVRSNSGGGGGGSSTPLFKSAQTQTQTAAFTYAGLNGPAGAKTSSTSSSASSISSTSSTSASDFSLSSPALWRLLSNEMKFSTPEGSEIYEPGHVHSYGAASLPTPTRGLDAGSEMQMQYPMDSSSGVSVDPSPALRLRKVAPTTTSSMKKMDQLQQQQPESQQHHPITSISFTLPIPSSLTPYITSTQSRMTSYLSSISHLSSPSIVFFLVALILCLPTLSLLRTSELALVWLLWKIAVVQVRRGGEDVTTSFTPAHPISSTSSSSSSISSSSASTRRQPISPSPSPTAPLVSMIQRNTERLVEGDPLARPITTAQMQLSSRMGRSGENTNSKGGEQQVSVPTTAQALTHRLTVSLPSSVPIVLNKACQNSPWPNEVPVSSMRNDDEIVENRVLEVEADAAALQNGLIDDRAVTDSPLTGHSTLSGTSTTRVDSCGSNDSLHLLHQGSDRRSSFGSPLTQLQFHGPLQQPYADHPFHQGRSQLVGWLDHEIRNSLHAIVAMTEFLSNSLPSANNATGANTTETNLLHASTSSGSISSGTKSDTDDKTAISPTSPLTLSPERSSNNAVVPSTHPSLTTTASSTSTSTSTHPPPHPPHAQHQQSDFLRRKRVSRSYEKQQSKLFRHSSAEESAGSSAEDSSGSIGLMTSFSSIDTSPLQDDPEECLLIIRDAAMSIQQVLMELQQVAMTSLEIVPAQAATTGTDGSALVLLPNGQQHVGGQNANHLVQSTPTSSSSAASSSSTSSRNTPTNHTLSSPILTTVIPFSSPLVTQPSGAGSTNSQQHQQQLQGGHVAPIEPPSLDLSTLTASSVAASAASLVVPPAAGMLDASTPASNLPLHPSPIKEEEGRMSGDSSSGSGNSGCSSTGCNTQSLTGCNSVNKPTPQSVTSNSGDSGAPSSSSATTDLKSSHHHPHHRRPTMEWPKNPIITTTPASLIQLHSPSATTTTMSTGPSNASSQQATPLSASTPLSQHLSPLPLPLPLPVSVPVSAAIILPPRFDPFSTSSTTSSSATALLLASADTATTAGSSLNSSLAGSAPMSASVLSTPSSDCSVSPTTTSNWTTNTSTSLITTGNGSVPVSIFSAAPSYSESSITALPIFNPLPITLPSRLNNGTSSTPGTPVQVNRMLRKSGTLTLRTSQNGLGQSNNNNAGNTNGVTANSTNPILMAPQPVDTTTSTQPRRLHTSQVSPEAGVMSFPQVLPSGVPSSAASASPAPFTPLVKIARTGLRTPPMHPTHTLASGTGSVDYRSCRVLVVDDSLINVKILSRMLHDLGLSVYTASDGAQAVEAVQKLAAVTTSKASRHERKLKRDAHIEQRKKEANEVSESESHNNNNTTHPLPPSTEHSLSQVHRAHRRLSNPLGTSPVESSESGEVSPPAPELNTQHPSVSPVSSVSSLSTTSASPVIPAEKAWRAKRHFDCILTDINMPVMTGIESSQRIRMLEKEHNLPRVPIIAVTANSSLEDRAACADAQIDYFIAKPFVKRDVLKLVEQILKAQTMSTALPSSAAISSSAAAASAAVNTGPPSLTHNNNQDSSSVVHHISASTSPPTSFLSPLELAQQQNEGNSGSGGGSGSGSDTAESLPELSTMTQLPQHQVHHHHPQLTLIESQGSLISPFPALANSTIPIMFDDHLCSTSSGMATPHHAVCDTPMHGGDMNHVIATYPMPSAVNSTRNLEITPTSAAAVAAFDSAPAANFLRSHSSEIPQWIGSPCKSVTENGAPRSYHSYEALLSSSTAALNSTLAESTQNVLT